MLCKVCQEASKLDQSVLVENVFTEAEYNSGVENATDMESACGLMNNHCNKKQAFHTCYSFSPVYNVKVQGFIDK